MANAWLVGSRYDGGWIFGGAALSLAIPVVVAWRPDWLIPLFWAWLVLFDGTHIWATYSRTYIDAQAWRERRPLLLASLVVFLVPLAAVVAALVGGGSRVLDLFLVLAPGWAYHHVVRQHYGLVSIYDRKAGTGLATHRVNRWCLYLGMWGAYLHFIVTHPYNRLLAGLPPPAPRALPEAIATWGSLAVVIGAGAVLAGWHARERLLDRAASWPAALLTATCLVTYGAAFAAVAAHEPFLPGARSTIEHFLVVGMMLSVFHNVQYHGVVWRFHRMVYRGETGHGPAGLLNRSILGYVASGLLFAAGYGWLAWSTADYPSPAGGLPEPRLVPVAFCLWWGVLFHHYYLDQRIWRPSASPQVRAALVA